MISELPGNNSDEISLLDLLVAMAENWKMLVFGPALAALLTFGLLWVSTPREYVSEALLRIDQRDIGIFFSEKVLDGPIAKSRLSQRHGGSLVLARQELLERKNLSVVPINESGLARIVLVDAGPPESVRVLLTEIIRSAIANSVPTGVEKERLELQALEKERSITDLRKTIDRLNMLTERQVEVNAEPGGIDVRFGDIGQAVVSILSSIEVRAVDLFNVRAQLSGTISSSDIVQQPTLPSRPKPRGLLKKTVFVTLGVGFVLLVVAFARDGLKRASEDLRSVGKVNRIRKAFGLRQLQLDQTDGLPL